MTAFLYKRNNPALITMIIWLVGSFIWTPISYIFIDKAAYMWISSFHMAWSGSLYTLIGTSIGELFLPISLYVLVVRKYFPNGIVDTESPNRYYKWMLITLVIGTYFLLVPNVTYEYAISNHLFLGATFIVVGLCEEYAYRGVLIRAFKDWLGVIPGVILGAVLFGLSHWADLMQGELLFSSGWFSGIMGASLVGLVLGIIVWRSGSILWAVYLHFMYDWRPWHYGNPNWVLNFHIPWLGNNISILVMGLIGAEILRFFTV
jgi:membrane protease YdiL (CAAX protease family)